MQENIVPKWKAWLIAARLRTLPLSLSGIVLGGAFAHRVGFFSESIFVLSIITGICLQILSNFANDYGDANKGTDGKGRLGPARMVTSGAITPKEMLYAIYIFIALCAVSGLALLTVSLENNLSKWLIFMGLGLASIAAAIFYTMGKKPYGYNGLGDFFVFIFFGLVSVVGSYCLYGAPLLDAPGFPACGVGLFAVAVLNINNIRDMDSDELHGKNTLALRLGEEGARQYHITIVAIGIICWVSYFLIMYGLSSLWILLFALPVVLSAYTVYTSDEHHVLDTQLKICSVGSGFFHLACAIYIFQV